MERIGLICEYNPFHNGHIYHIQKIKDLYPNSILILVLNGYFLQRGDISLLTKEEKTKIALENQIDLVVELPILYGSQSADNFAQGALSILNSLKVNKVVFGSESNNIEGLIQIAKIEEKKEYHETVKKFLKKGFNYPTALAKSLNSSFNFNTPNDLLAISYIKAIQKNHYSIQPISILRTNAYHDITSNEKIVSASNIRHKFFLQEDISPYLPKNSLQLMKRPNYDLFFHLLKFKILTTPHLEQFLTVDEGIENRLYKEVQKASSLEEFIQKIKTKRYTYNKINRMFLHILLGITKEDLSTATLDYIHILGFNETGRKYLQKRKKEINFPLSVNKNSIFYQYEIKASILYDLLQNTNNYNFETQNKPILK